MYFPLIGHIHHIQIIFGLFQYVHICFFPCSLTYFTCPMSTHVDVFFHFSGAAQRTTAEPNWSSDQRNFQFTAPVSAPASASIYQSVQASTDASLRQHRVAPQHTYMDTSGRSTANLINYPSGGMGLAYRRQA